MFSGLTLVTPPAFDPISVADLKAHARYLASAEDGLLAGYIAAATRNCEKITKRAFLPQTWRVALRHFPGRSYLVGYQQARGLREYYKFSKIPLPKPPLVSIVSFNYFDTLNTQYSMTQGYGNLVGNYVLDTEPEPGEIRLPFAGIWPTTILLPASPIQITYNCGYPSFTGTATVDVNGVASLVTGAFDPRLVGTWMTFGGQSFDVASYSPATLSPPAPAQLQLTWSNNGLVTLPFSTAVPFRGSAVPVGIQMAILYLATHYFQNRIPVATGRGLISVEVQSTLDDILAGYRINIVGMPDPD